MESVYLCSVSLAAFQVSRETHTPGPRPDKLQEVEFGTILSTNPVVIEGRQTDVGQLPGAIIGGVAGSSVGEGKGQEIFTFLGPSVVLWLEA